MLQRENWTEEEFDKILYNPNSTNDELSVLLNGRNTASIASVRAFIHNFHIRGNISGMSDFMVKHLRAGYWTCPLCHAKVEKHGYRADKGWIT